MWMGGSVVVRGMAGAGGSGSGSGADRGRFCLHPMCVCVSHAHRDRIEIDRMGTMRRATETVHRPLHNGPTAIRQPVASPDLLTARTLLTLTLYVKHRARLEYSKIRG